MQILERCRSELLALDGGAAVVSFARDTRRPGRARMAL
jgi:hypothetical protein